MTCLSHRFQLVDNGFGLTRHLFYNCCKIPLIIRGRQCREVFFAQLLGVFRGQKTPNYRSSFHSQLSHFEAKCSITSNTVGIVVTLGGRLKSKEFAASGLKKVPVAMAYGGWMY